MTLAFSFQAIDQSGKRVRGQEEAPSAAALAQSLEARGLVVLELAPERLRSKGREGFGFGRRREVLEVTRALAALLPAGLPLARALATSANMATGEVATAVDEVRAAVERGDALADSLAGFPQLFSPLYIGLVRAGERSGDLTGAFARLAQQLEREDQLRAKLLSVSIYPLLLATAGGSAVLVLLLFVMPRFVELLQGTGATLPKSTAMLLAFSSGVRHYWPVLIVAAIGLALLLAWMRTAEAGRRVGSELLLRLPLVRRYRQHALAARFARLMGVLLSGGAPLLSALDDALECLGDPLARDEVVRVRGRVREGIALNQALGEGELFPPLLRQLVAVGEESGRLQDFLLKAAEILEEKTGRVLERLVALAEPAMIIVFGGLVGFVALSLLQAIYSVNAGSFR